MVDFEKVEKRWKKRWWIGGPLLAIASVGTLASFITSLDPICKAVGRCEDHSVKVARFNAFELGQLLAEIATQHALARAEKDVQQFLALRAKLDPPTPPIPNDGDWKAAAASYATLAGDLNLRYPYDQDHAGPFAIDDLATERRSEVVEMLTDTIRARYDQRAAEAFDAGWQLSIIELRALDNYYCTTIPSASPFSYLYLEAAPASAKLTRIAAAFGQIESTDGQPDLKNLDADGKLNWRIWDRTSRLEEAIRKQLLP
jgi:hypothetical protein